MGIYYENEQYPYLYETHLHTKEASACAHNTGVEMVRALKNAGYTGMFITNHFYYGNTSVSRRLLWKEWVEKFTQGFEEAREEGECLGVQVFFGWEAGYNATEFLVYGLDKQWLLNHPEIKDASVEEQYQIVKNDGGMVIHAHPYREEWYIPKIRLFPEFVDGVEAINATHSNRRSTSHNDPVYDKRAQEYAKKYNFPMTAGSDIHSVNVYGGGMAFPTKLETSQDFIKAVLNRTPYLLLNGNEGFFKKI